MADLSEFDSYKPHRWVLEIINWIVDPSNGCSLEQLSPCEGPRGQTETWKNHGQYMKSVAQTANSFLEQGLITEEEKGTIVSGAANSTCGVK